MKKTRKMKSSQLSQWVDFVKIYTKNKDYPSNGSPSILGTVNFNMLPSCRYFYSPENGDRDLDAIAHKAADLSMWDKWSPCPGDELWIKCADGDENTFVYTNNEWIEKK